MAHVHPPPVLNLPPAINNEVSTDNAEQSAVLIENPEKEWLPQLPPPRRGIYLISAKIALVLIFATSYLTFCFFVRYRNVPVGRSGVLGPPSLHLSTVSVITTVAILLVYVALWPINDVIDDIRSEEFFRFTHTHPHGVPLDSVNAVSATTTGPFDIIMATIHRHCSPLLTSTLVISLLITTTSSIAPAALSAESIWIDVDNSTFLIGALPRFNESTSLLVEGLIPLALTMAWVENFLNFTNGYSKVTNSEGDQFGYLVPFPPEYTSTLKAHWTTDVIVLNPSCSWQTATTTQTLDLIWDVTLSKSNLSVILTNYDFVSGPSNMTKISVFPCFNKSSEFAFPIDGSVLFIIDQLGYPNPDSLPRVLESVDINSVNLNSMNLSSIPTSKFPPGNVLAFLVCSPHVSIQTRQVWATGNGNLTLGEPQRSQGNIDFYQANYLLSRMLLSLPTIPGPTRYTGQVGTDLLTKLIFGTGAYDDASPAPLTNITAMYRQVIQSAVKTFMSGAIATENAPGGYTEEQLVFTSSLGHVIASAILFAFLTIALVAVQFRKERDAFTFVNVAAALADSNAPQKCVEMTQFKVGTGERNILKLVPSGDGRSRLAIGLGIK